MFPNTYKQIAEDLAEIFNNFISKKNVTLSSILNKITFIDKNKFETYDEKNDQNVFDEAQYIEALKKQKRQLNELFLKIEEDMETSLKELFDYNQTLLIRFITNGIDKKMIDRKMKIEYLFEKSLLQNEKYKSCLLSIFKQMEDSYSSMKNSLAYLENGQLYNQTNLNVNDDEAIFDKKNKILVKLRQDLVMAFLFYKNNIITKKDLNRFIVGYIDTFKELALIEYSNILEKETIKIWATGVRYIEVLLDNFKYSNKYINLCIEQKDLVNKYCPSLRFM
jgi:hypothetical protein